MKKSIQNTNEANTLIVDIETFPMRIDAWEPYEANALRTIFNTSMCGFSAKWLGGKQITRTLADYKGYKAGDRNDKNLLKDLWPLLDKADIVIAHNGDRFDIPKINARFLQHGMLPPSPYKTIDTLKIARAIFGFDSNRLNDVGKVLDLGEKIHTGGFSLWVDCDAGVKKAWAKMRDYNAQDVILLEKIYLKFRPWIKSHPNMNMFSKFRAGCPKCGSQNVQARGFSVTSTGRYQRFQCQDCGGWGKTTKAEKETKPLVNA